MRFFKYFLLLCFLATNFLSCTEENCEDLDLGEIMPLDEGPDYLDLTEIESLEYKNQDGEITLVPIVNWGYSTRDRRIEYQCLKDDNFYTAAYQTRKRSVRFRLEELDRYFEITEETDLALPRSQEHSGSNTQADLEGEFANRIQIWVFNGFASSLKMTLYTTSNSPSYQVEDINPFENRAFEFYESIELNGRVFNNVYSNRHPDFEGTEVFYSKEFGLIQFTDAENNVLTLEKIVFR